MDYFSLVLLTQAVFLSQHGPSDKRNEKPNVQPAAVAGVGN